MVVGASNNAFTKWKAVATFVPQPKDNSHGNAKAHWQVLLIPKAQMQTKILKKEVTLGFILLSTDFLKGKTSEKMFTLGAFL